MSIILENDFIKATFKPLGAELISLYDKASGEELLWQGSKESWKGQSPLLFPIIGRLKNSCYLHEGKEYTLNSHGFARQSEFGIVKQTQTSICFFLSDSDSTMAVYPFKFNLFVEYELKGNKLTVSFSVKNTDSKMIYFGIGGHPGFNIPCKETAEETIIDGNSLSFEVDEKPEHYILEHSEILIEKIVPYKEIKEMSLTKSLFADDAILLKNLKSRFVTLNRQDKKRIRFWFYDVPYLAFWTNAKKGGYICIEPWCGLPDYYKPTSEIKNKEGINSLIPDATFNYKYDIEII